MFSTNLFDAYTHKEVLLKKCLIVMLLSYLIHFTLPDPKPNGDDKDMMVLLILIFSFASFGVMVALLFIMFDCVGAARWR